MPVTLALGTVVSTNVNVGVTGAGGASFSLQVADNPRFEGLAPMRAVSVANGGSINIPGLNPGGTYFARGRLPGEDWGNVIGFTTPASGSWNTAAQAVQVAPAIVVVPEPIVSIQVTGQNPGYPAANLLNDDPSLVTEVTSLIYVETTGAPIDTIALLDTTAGEDMIIYIASAPTFADVSTGANSTVHSNNALFRASANLPQRRGYHGLWRLGAASTHRWWRFQITGGGIMNATLLMRYLVMGRARTAKNIASDKLESPLDLGSIDRGRDGTADRVFGHRMRKVDFEIAMLNEMQWETQFGDLWRKIGLNEPVLVIPNTRSGAFLHDRILYGTLAAHRAVNHMAPRFTQSFSIESLI